MCFKYSLWYYLYWNKRLYTDVIYGSIMRSIFVKRDIFNCRPYAIIILQPDYTNQKSNFKRYTLLVIYGFNRIYGMRSLTSFCIWVLLYQSAKNDIVIWPKHLANFTSTIFKEKKKDHIVHETEYELITHILFIWSWQNP
jgi:hypothetical protein